ncbi:hypothetical protein CN383_16355 [Priestia megaterium]|uniref:EAL domain-containing protein n=1 Tax=Priestia megaterium TaxID=1404 RepID=UPI000BF899FC|nr:EAL domain-containing protein [Priestia megaterium]PFA99221.1 hypothetical protein CN383_16355 [Priestia megaterium]
MEVYFKGILKERKFHFFYQPIYDLNTWGIIAFESLLRVSDHPKLNIEQFFLIARSNHELYDLDTAAIEGAGSATLKQIIEYKPKYIKLDRYFAKNLASSKEKQQIVQLLTNYNVNDTILILEGIEDKKDLATSCALNVPFAQGYLLGKPQPILHYKTQYQFHNSIYTYL